MNLNNSPKPVVLYNSASKRSQFFNKKLAASVAGVASFAIIGITILPGTIYAWAPQPYCRNGQTVMISYDETNHVYNAQPGDVAGACPSPTPTPTPVPTSSPSPTPTAAPCVTTDLKGTFNHSDNHFAGNPVTGTIQNVSTNPSCPTTVWVDIYGSSHTQPEDSGWLESQQFVSQVSFDVPAGTSKNISIDVASKGFCLYQVDMVRTAAQKVPPVFNGTDMIDYAFVKDNNACQPSPTPTASPNVTIINNNTNNNNVTVVNPSSSPAVIAASTTTAQELPKTGLPLAGVALGGLTPLGMKLKKFKSAKDAMSANFIWEKRQLGK